MENETKTQEPKYKNRKLDIKQQIIDDIKKTNIIMETYAQYTN